MPETQNLVTILLPFYKEGTELDRAIESITQQTFPHWQLLLISNNGNSTGLNIAQKWVEKDPRIKMLHEPRQGIAHALNTGLQHCKSPYIARMDADDISHPERLVKQFHFLENNPSIDVVCSQTTFQTAIPGSEGFEIFVNWQNSIITPEEHFQYRFIESPIAHPTIMFRKELAEKFGPYSTLPVPEDYELWLRWMDQNVCFYKIPEPLLTWNDHSERLTRTHENYSREAFFQVKCEYLAKWIKRNVPSGKKIVVCGSSRIGRKRAAMLQELGVEIFGFTDVKKRPNRQVNFIRIPEITQPQPWFLINFIARRGVGQAIREHFSALGFVEGKDFILAA
ncbi:MAG: glycosyltransferase [Bacteroidales bacterium]|nr:glycosyltransferase [Bacteroidales bacterium]